MKLKKIDWTLRANIFKCHKTLSILLSRCEYICSECFSHSSTCSSNSFESASKKCWNYRSLSKYCSIFSKNSLTSNLRANNAANKVYKLGQQCVINLFCSIFLSLDELILSNNFSTETTAIFAPPHTASKAEGPNTSVALDETHFCSTLYKLYCDGFACLGVQYAISSKSSSGRRLHTLSVLSRIISNYSKPTKGYHTVPSVRKVFNVSAISLQLNKTNLQNHGLSNA